MDPEKYSNALRSAFKAIDPELCAAVFSEDSLSVFLRSCPRRVEPHKRWLRHKELSRWLGTRPNHLQLLQARALLRLDLDLMLHAYSDADRALLLIRAGGEQLPSLQQTGEMAVRMLLVQLDASLKMRNVASCQQGVKNLLATASEHFALSDGVRHFVGRFMDLVAIRPLNTDRLGEIVDCFVECRGERDVLPLLRVLYECAELLCLQKGVREVKLAMMGEVDQDRFDAAFEFSRFHTPMQWRGDSDRTPGNVADALSMGLPLMAEPRTVVVPSSERGGFKTIATQKISCPASSFASTHDVKTSVIIDGPPVGYLSIETDLTQCGHCASSLDASPAKQHRKCRGCEVVFCSEKCFVMSRMMTTHDIFCGVTQWNNYLQRMKHLHVANLLNASCSLSFKLLVTAVSQGKPLSSWPQFKVLFSRSDSSEPVDPFNVPIVTVDVQGEQIVRCFDIFREYCPLWASFITLEDLVNTLMVVEVNAFETRKNSSSAVFCQASFINHSCEPNCSYDCGVSMLFVTPLREIKAGEEITITYTDPNAPVDVRRMKLQHFYGFYCICKRCERESS